MPRGEAATLFVIGEPRQTSAGTLFRYIKYIGNFSIYSSGCLNYPFERNSCQAGTILTGAVSVCPPLIQPVTAGSLQPDAILDERTPVGRMPSAIAGEGPVTCCWVASWLFQHKAQSRNLCICCSTGTYKRVIRCLFGGGGDRVLVRSACSAASTRAWRHTFVCWFGPKVALRWRDCRSTERESPVDCALWLVAP